MNDVYDTVINNVFEPVVDYYDFPSSMIAFGESLKNSFLSCIDGVVYFRQRNKQLTLLTWYCASDELMNILIDLQKCDYNIKSLNYVHKDMQDLKLRTYGWEWWIDNTWDINAALSSHSKSTAKRALRKISAAAASYDIIPFDQRPFTLDQALEVFYAWYDAAKTRQFMVVKGHYLRYIHRFFECQNNVKFIGGWTEFGELYAIFGYEVFAGKAQATLYKQRPGDNNFVHYMYPIAADMVLGEGVDKVFYGSMSDKLKRFYAFNFDKSYKLVL